MAISTTHPLTGHLFRCPVGAIPWPKVWSYCQELTRSAPAGEVTTGTLRERPRNLVGSFRWNDSLLSGILQEPSQVEVKQMRLVCNEVAILNTLSLPGLKMLWNCGSFHAAPGLRVTFLSYPREGWCLLSQVLCFLCWPWLDLGQHCQRLPSDLGADIPMGSVCSMGSSLGSAVDFLESLSSPKRLVFWNWEFWDHKTLSLVCLQLYGGCWRRHADPAYVRGRLGPGRCPIQNTGCLSPFLTDPMQILAQIFEEPWDSKLTHKAAVWKYKAGMNLDV